MFSTTGAAHAAGFELAVDGELVSSAETGLSGKTQPGVRISASAVFPFMDVIGPGVSLSWGNVWPSDLSGGFGYRGYWEGELSLFAFFHVPVFSIKDAGLLRAGCKAGMSASMADYQSTTLAFFLPSVDVSPFLSFSPFAFRGWSFSLAVPARILIRRDLAWSWSIGIEAGAMYTPGKGT